MSVGKQTAFWLRDEQPREQKPSWQRAAHEQSKQA